MPLIFRSLFLALATHLFCSGLSAQTYTISGYVKDAQNGEVLIGAIIYVPALKAHAATNAYGFYSLTLPTNVDTETVIFSYVGYQPVAKKLKVHENLHLNIELKIVEMKEAVITAHKEASNVEKPQMGVIDVPIQQVKELPAIFGEKDLFKVLQLLPGVQSGSEASAGFYVRGGGADQNLILLDEAVIYNPFHLAGFFSTFNADAIKSVSLVKGGYPAQYGGRLSSIIDVTMKDGNDKEVHGEGGIGIISSRLTLEGPIKKNKSSFMVSARRTYLDLLIRPLLPKGESAGYYFYDLNGKVNYRFSDKDRVYLSGYLGRDVFSSTERSVTDTTSFGTNWGNKSVTARWNHLYSDKLFSNVTLLYNDYNFRIESFLGGYNASLSSGIRDNAGKVDFDWFASIKQHVKFGGFYTYQTFIPSLVEGKGFGQDFKSEQMKFVHQGALYVNDEYTFNEYFAINVGIRAPFFIYKKTNYKDLEPRFNAKYSLNKSTSIKASYTWMDQYIHLLSNSSLASPMDLWVPSSDIVKPQQAQQVALGLFRNFKDNSYESSVELYYKNMTNLIEYKPGANIFFNPEIDKELVFGTGWAYGAEFFVRKTEGRITGWVGYTLSYAWRQFPDIQKDPYPATYDRRHDIALAGVYNFSKEWSFSTVFVFGTGHSQTLAQGTYVAALPNEYGGYTQVQDYGSKNDYKLNPYNRLDIGIKRTKKHKHYESDLRFDIYNVYSRRNPYFIFVSSDEYDARTNSYKPALKQVSLFPMIPSISYNFRF